MDDCPLCRLEQRTTWYHEEADFAVIECCTCHVPLAVVRRHALVVGDSERRRMLAELRRVANGLYGPGNWRLDEQMRAVKDHWHVHARPTRS